MKNRYLLLFTVMSVAAGLLSAMSFTLGTSASHARIVAADSRCRPEVSLGQGRAGTGVAAAEAVGPGAMDAELAARVALFRGTGLSDNQRAAIERIQREHDRHDVEFAGAILAEQSKLRAWSAKPLPDPQRIGASYASVSKWQRKMVEADVATWNRLHAVLDSAQKQQVRLGCSDTSARTAVAGSMDRTG
jgi:hypothetical protein